MTATLKALALADRLEKFNPSIFPSLGCNPNLKAMSAWREQSPDSDVYVHKLDWRVTVAAPWGALPASAWTPDGKRTFKTLAEAGRFADAWVRNNLRQEESEQ